MRERKQNLTQIHWKFGHYNFKEKIKANETISEMRKKIVEKIKIRNRHIKK